MTEQEAFDRWTASDESRKKYRGAFSAGFEDARLRKGDWGRRAYPAGDARHAYHIGRMYAAMRKWPK